MASTDGAQSLRTASSYINNLLLSRGLLRNGQPIGFASPAEAEGGLDATMAKVMNLVHDLILRRDREQNTLSSLSESTTSLRTSVESQTQTIARLETRTTDLDRQLAIVAGSERTAKNALRTAETRIRTLKEEMARLKGTVKEIRAQCANDIRKRDGEIQRLKRHLEGRRGVNGAGQVGVVVVTPGNGKGPQQRPLQASEGSNGSDPSNPEYSLKEETTEFLTQLSQGLSDENDQLISLVNSTLATLRSLQGLPEPPHRDQSSANVNVSLPPSYDELACDTAEVLDHLRGLLTNPSFVPLEEVEVRDDEIQRLREGWERMALRWKDAVALMDGWRKRMVDTGGTVNLDDLTQGLKLDEGMLENPADAAAKENVGANADDDSEDGLRSDSMSDENEICGDDASRTPSSDAMSLARTVDEVPRKVALGTTSGNARAFPTPRKVSLSSLAEELVKDLSPVDREEKIRKVRRTLQRRSPSDSSPDMAPPSPPRSVRQRLELAQQEADEAREADQEAQGKRKRSAIPRINKRLGGSRRRSTLRPDELEHLLGIV